MRRNGHDRACAIAHEDIIRNPDRHALAVHRVDGVTAGKDARLYFVYRFTLHIRLAHGLLDISLYICASLWRGDLFDQRMFRGQYHKRHAPQGIRAGGKDLE